MSKINELLSFSSDIMSAIEDAEGELTDEICADVDAFKADSADYLERLWHVRSRLKAERERLQDIRESIANRIAAVERSLDRVRDLATRTLEERQALGEDPKVRCDEFTVYLRTVQSVIGPADGESWPEHLREWYCKPKRQLAKEILLGDTAGETVEYLAERGIRLDEREVAVFTR